MKKLMKFLLIAGASLCLLTACGGDEEVLEAYTLDGSGETVVAFDSVLNAGEAVMTSVDVPTEMATQAGLELSHTYHYGQMEDPAALAARYIGVLRDEQGFTPVDDQIRQLAEDPNLETLTGSLILAKKTESDSKKLFRVVVDWSEYAVAVQVAEVAGRIQPPPEPPKEESSDESGTAIVGAGSQPTSMPEQIEYFYTLDPAKLGLDGSDMSEYTVYAQQGRVLVDSISCREIMVYRADEQSGQNVYMGTYFISSDLANLYKKLSDGRIVAVENFK